MEGAILSVTNNNNRFRNHLKNAANALCAKTLPKPRRIESTSGSTVKHHTYPRAAPPKRASIPCRMEPLMLNATHHALVFESPIPEPIQYQNYEPQKSDNHNEPVEPRGSLSKVQDDSIQRHMGTDQEFVDGARFSSPEKTFSREVANAWECRVGPPEQPAAADRVQSLFNDIELYPTKTQVFEMLVCARQCARRKSLTLTFGEFCVFAAELRRCSRQSRQTSNKPESPVWNVEKELRDKETICRHVNGSEATPPPEVFLGGSCNPTTWRSDIAIPMLKKMGITYFNPQVEDWSTELMEVEHRAKAAARALLFVLDSETRAVATSVEAAHLASAPKDLLLVLRPYTRHQTIGHETISDHEYVELSRARATLQEAIERRGLPAFTDIPAALRCARAVLRGARTHPRHSLGHTILRLKRAYDAAGGRSGRLSRSTAVDALRDVTRVPRDLANRCFPNTSEVDFETFCAAVAELAADAVKAAEGPRPVETTEASRSRGVVEVMTSHISRALRSLRLLLDHECKRNGQEASGVTEPPRDPCERVSDTPRESNGLRGQTNARLRAYGKKLGLFIPKNGGNAASVGTGTGTGESESSVFTPGTERRLERLPAMLGAPTHDVYLAGTFPSNGPRPEEVLKRENISFVAPRANDYTRMFSTPARRAAPTHPESPRRDKKPRPEPSSPVSDEVQLRDTASKADRTDRLSASDFYTVTEDHTPQPFKGTYDEDLLLGSRVLVFSMSAEAPCFAAMVLAAHYMGLRPAATVLLVQPMDPQKVTNYSEAAVKDYNRGRHYLSDLARRSGVAVFDNVAATMHYVIDRLRTAT